MGISTHPNSSVLAGVTAPFLLLLLCTVGGCAGDPDLASSRSDLRTETIERAAWQRASAGCEDAERFGAELHPAAGEPLLGVLVSQGHVLCVDSMSLLVQETREDPTPTPLLPVLLRDPTPTPAVDD